MLSTEAFYRPYHGHTPAELEVVANALRAHGGGRRSIVWLAGDSSLDNKFWLDDARKIPAANGLASVFSPPHTPPDIAAHLNILLASELPTFGCVNAAVEESTLGGRGSALSRGAPFLSSAQDALLARCLEAGDVIVASAGGNDVVLKPAVSTVAALGAVLALGSDAGIDSGAACGMGTLVALFKREMEAYLAALTAATKPVCALALFPYFPGVTGNGWADTSLSLMGYTGNPARLQRVMRAVYKLATQQLVVPGVTVVPLALFDVLDANEEGDYVARVEPSAKGGAKMARAIVDAVKGALGRLGRRNSRGGGGGGGSGSGGGK
jgi:hypothetical protein